MASKSVAIGAVVLGISAVMLTITNPSLADFKAQRASQDGLMGLTCNAVETKNYVVFSRYEYRCMMSTTQYVGVLGNYYQLKDDKQA